MKTKMPVEALITKYFRAAGFPDNEVVDILSSRNETSTSVRFLISCLNLFPTSC